MYSDRKFDCLYVHVEHVIRNIEKCISLRHRNYNVTRKSIYGLDGKVCPPNNAIFTATDVLVCKDMFEVPGFMIA